MTESKARGGVHRGGGGYTYNTNRMARVYNNSNNRRGRNYNTLGIEAQAYQYRGGQPYINSNRGGRREYDCKWQQQQLGPYGPSPQHPQQYPNEWYGVGMKVRQNGQYTQYQNQRLHYPRHYRNQNNLPPPNMFPKPLPYHEYQPTFVRMMGNLQLQPIHEEPRPLSPPLGDEEEEWAWHEMTFGGQGDSNHVDSVQNHVPQDDGMFDMNRVAPYLPVGLHDLLFNSLKPLMSESNAAQFVAKRTLSHHMGVDDFDSLSVTDSGVFSDNDGCSSGRASPVSCKAGELGGERDRFAILTYDQVKRVDSVLNEMVALEGRGNFPALELKLKDLLTAVKDRLVQEGIKIRDIRLNGGAASYALKDRLDFCCVCGVVYTPSGDDGGMLCSCLSSEGQTKNFSYNDIDLIFGMELTTAKHFDRVKTAVLDALLDLLPPQVSRKRMSPCALKEAYVSKMVKVCEGDRWSLIALGNGPAVNSSSKGRSCSVELKFVDTMRRQYEFSVDSFQIVLDSLMLFYKCATVPMSGRFYPTVVGESVFGDFYGALYHLQNGLIATRHPEEIRGGGLLKYCNLLVRGYRPADAHSIPPLQRYMCSRFFIDFPEVEQQESKLRTYLANHMSGVSARLRYAFLITLYHVVDSSTVCLMGHERRLTLNLIQRLACELFSTDCGQGIYGPQPNQMYQCYSSYYSPQCTLTNSSSATTASLTESNHPAPSANGTTYYPTPQISASTSAPAVVSATPIQPHNFQTQRPTGPLAQKSCSTSSKTLRHSLQQSNQNAPKASSTPPVPLLTASS